MITQTRTPNEIFILIMSKVLISYNLYSNDQNIFVYSGISKMLNILYMGSPEMHNVCKKFTFPRTWG